jgi:hypothetical protein
MKKDYQEFESTLLFNIKQRSRTANGKSKTGVSSMKLPLLVGDEVLEQKVKENLLQTAQIVWNTPLSSSPAALNEYFFEWFDLLQDGLIDYEGYRPKREELEKKYALTAGKEVTLNPRYRLWEVHYDLARIQPREIDSCLNSYVTYISRNLDMLSGELKDYIRFLAYADRELDRVIHPWLDGCGRFATVLIMWLAANSPHPYPKFRPHSEHYASMITKESHEHYFGEITK